MRFSKARMLAQAALALALSAGLAMAQPAGAPARPKQIGQRYAYNFGGPTQGGLGATVPYRSAAEEYAALKAKANGGGRLSGPDMPDWGGVWHATPGSAQFNFDPSLMRDADDYGPLNDKGKAAYHETLAKLEKGVEWDRLSACLDAGFPRIMGEGFMHEFAVTPSIVYLIAETQTEVRRVYVDGRDHLDADSSFPMWEGDSIGFWDGKGEHAKLVVWTRSVRDGQYHRNGPPYSDKLEAVEQIWKDGADVIHEEMTVYDPVYLTRPWHVSRAFARDKTAGVRIVDQWVCAENNNVVQTANGSSDFKLPGEAGYKDPNKIGGDK